MVLARRMVEPMERDGPPEIRADIRRMIAARLIVSLLGAAMLSWLAAQLLLHGNVSVVTAARVMSAAVLGPILVWAVSGMELRLLRELARRHQQVDQRTREITSLNQMAQAHLAECTSLAPTGQGVFQDYQKPDAWRAFLFNADHDPLDARALQVAGSRNGN